MRNLIAFILISLFGLVSCGKNNESGKSGSSGDDNGPVVNQQNIQGMHFDWANVPAQFNPHLHNEEFSIIGLERLNLDIADIETEINVVYTNNLRNSAVVEFFRAHTGGSTFGPTRVMKNLNRQQVDVVNGYMNDPSQCYQRIYQRQLIELEGACNLFIRVILPTNSHMEVFSRGRVFSKRFNPMNFEQLMDRLNTGFSQDQFQAVEEYISSHKETGKPLILTAFQLEKILNKFAFTDDFKFSALIELYPYVSDRRNVEQAINNSFSFPSNRVKAKRMIGIA